MALGDFKKGFEPVGESLVGAEDAKISLLAIELRHVPQETPEHVGIANTGSSRCRKVDTVVAKVRQT